MSKRGRFDNAAGGGSGTWVWLAVDAGSKGGAEGVMHWEVEQKFFLADRGAAERRIVKSGIVLAEAVVQADYYFNHPSRDFGQTDEALRIRQQGEQSFITYKGPKIDAQTKTRREIELPLAAGSEGVDSYARLLEALGFRLVATVRKARRYGEIAWQDARFEVALDDVEGVGPFIELETVADDAGLDAARTKLAALALHLGLEHVERRSYLELLLSRQAGQ